MDLRKVGSKGTAGPITATGRRARSPWPIRLVGANAPTQAAMAGVFQSNPAGEPTCHNDERKRLQNRTAKSADTATEPGQVMNPNDWFRVPIAALRLGVRCCNCLARRRIMTVGELCEWSMLELLESQSFGECALHEIREALAVHGLALRDD